MLRRVGSDQELAVGLRLLSASERAGTYQRAKVAAKVVPWDDTDPNCALELYVETVAAAAFDVDGEPGAFEAWASAEELRSDRSLGQEHLAFLYEAYRALESEHLIRPEDLQGTNFLNTVWRAGSGDRRPLERMPRDTLVAFAATLAGLQISSMIEKLPSTSASDSSLGSTPTSA